MITYLQIALGVLLLISLIGNLVLSRIAIEVSTSICRLAASKGLIEKGSISNFARELTREYKRKARS
jgi:hypothetical protein